MTGGLSDRAGDAKEFASGEPAKNFRRAALLNLFLPGSGLFYLGQRRLGSLLGAAFVCCLGASLGTFLVGYAQYLNVALDPQMLEGDKLEHVADRFHPRWLVGLLAAGLVIYLISMFFLFRARRAARSVSSLS